MESSTSTPTRLLVVHASPRAESFSAPLAEAFVERFVGHRPDAEVDRLDVFADLEPFGARHTAAKMAVIAGEPVPADAAAEWEQAQRLGARLRSADLLVFAVPMWNGGVPWALKLFIDIVTQPGVVFAFDPDTGYRGLLGGRRAVAVYTSQVFSPGVAPAFGVDHQSTYLRWWLEFAGIRDIDEVRLQPTYATPDLAERRTAALHDARTLADRLAGARLEAVR